MFEIIQSFSGHSYSILYYCFNYSLLLWFDQTLHCFILKDCRSYSHFIIDFVGIWFHVIWHCFVLKGNVTPYDHKYDKCIIHALVETVGHKVRTMLLSWFIQVSEPYSWPGWVFPFLILKCTKLNNNDLFVFYSAKQLHAFYTIDVFINKWQEIFVKHDMLMMEV